MAALIRAGNNGGREDRWWRPNISSRSQVRQNCDRLRLGDAPIGFDRVIVSGFSQQDDTGRVVRHLNVKVNGNGRRGVGQFFGVNMEKRRLQEPPE